MVVGGLLAGILIVEVVISGISVSTTSTPAAIPGAPAPPCGAIEGDVGWLISFWVSEWSGFRGIFFHRILI
jgi:hypothetical protein